MDLNIYKEIQAIRSEISKHKRAIVLCDCIMVLSSILLGLTVGKIIWG